MSIFPRRSLFCPVLGALVLSSAAAAAQQSPVDLIVERLMASSRAAFEFNTTAAAKMIAVGQPATSTVTQADAAEQAVAALFQEPWGPALDIWWSWRSAGSSDPFVPAVYSMLLGSRSMQDLVLLPHPHDTSFFGELPDNLQAFLTQVPPSMVSTFVYSARFGGSLRTVGYAASFTMPPAEVLCFAPIQVVAEHSPVSSEHLAVGLWLAVQHAGSGAPDYATFVQWVVGDEDTSMDGPLRPFPETAAPYCRPDLLLQCLSQAWAAFVQQKAALLAGLKAALAQEVARYFQARAAAAANQFAALPQQRAVVIWIMKSLGMSVSGEDAAAIDALWAGYEAQLNQLKATHEANVAALKRGTCEAIRDAMDNAIGQVIACFHLHCPDLEDEARAILAAARAQLIADVGGCL
jgi:hypothetical protein